MSARALLLRLLSVLLPLALAASLHLYLYPVFHGCAFALPAPNPPSRNLHAVLNTLRQHIAPQSAAQPAPFRLLVLADPQLEGDTSLPSPDDELLPRLRGHWAAISSSAQSAQSPLDAAVVANITIAARSLVVDDLPRALRGVRKRLDLLGNDFYLAHIYRALHWWTVPTHVTVLGDLVGSQWVSDEEFEWRGRRFWERVFRGGERVDDGITAGSGERGEEGDTVTVADSDSDSAWARRIINVAGNHDIGYAGDVSAARMERFERVFGRANWDTRFEFPQHSFVAGGQNSSHASTPPTPPTLHLINLNSLTLDTPPLDEDIQTNSYAYLSELITRRSRPVEDRSSFTLLLTHVPLHKNAGICTDGPRFVFHESDDEDSPDDTPRFREGGLEEQNHLSDHVSANGVLQGIFGMNGNEEGPGGGWGRNGLILTGHDHTGCDVVHFVNRSADADEAQNSWEWSARRYSEQRGREPTPSIREVTLRSMMGEFGGNAGLLSLWFDADPAVKEWKYEMSTCAAGVQHIWWAVHVLDVVAVGLLLVYLVSGQTLSKPTGVQKASAGRAKTQKTE
jgi:hypothetical protein